MKINFNKRLVSILLCLMLIGLQVFVPDVIVHAQEELKVSTEITGLTVLINNEPYVAAMSNYSVKYQLTNNSSSEMKDIQIFERAPGAGDFKQIYISGKASLQNGESLPAPAIGASIKADPEDSPAAVEYKIVYTIEGQERTSIQGYTPVHIIQTDFRVNYTASVSGPVFKGEQVTLKAEVESVSNVTLYNITVTDTDLGEEIGIIDVLEPGRKATVQKTLSLEKSTLGNLDIIFDDPVGVSQPVRKHVKTDLVIQVREDAPVSSLNVSGNTKQRLIPGPAQVDFELIIKNTGNTQLNDLKCLDWNGKELHTQKELKPGEEITVTFAGKIEPEETYDVLVQARVENSLQQIQSNWSFRLGKLEPKVEIQRKLSVEEIKKGEPFELEYVLRNIGNVELLDIKISETSFGEVTTLDKLAVGQEVTFSKELVLNESTFSRTILTALDAETEKEYSYESADMGFVVGGQGEGVPLQALSIILQTEQETLNRPGSVEMECIIENTGQEPLYNLILTLMEREMVIDNIAVLEPGEKKTISIPAVRIEETEIFWVAANGLGADHQKFTAESEPLTITLSESGLSGQFSILRTVLIVIILLCILVIGVLVYTLRDSIKLPFRKRKDDIRRR
jgi:hypothetical protein